MRHLGSLLAGLVVGAAAWILLCYGQTEIKAAWDDSRWLENVAVLAAAGLLIGLIATLRSSPLGPLVVGVAYTGYGVTALWRKTVFNVLPTTVTVGSRHAPLHAPVQNGTAIVIGVLLLTAIISVRRWQRWPKPVAPVVTDVVEPAAPGDVTPAAAATAGVAATGVRPSPRHAASEENHEGTEAAEPTRDETSPRPTRAQPEPTPQPAPTGQSVAERVEAANAPEPEQAATVTAPEPTTAEAARPSEEWRVPGTSPWAAPPRQAPR